MLNQFFIILSILQVCGLKWSHDDRELASGGNDNQVVKSLINRTSLLMSFLIFNIWRMKCYYRVQTDFLSTCLVYQIIFIVNAVLVILNFFLTFSAIDMEPAFSATSSKTHRAHSGCQGYCLVTSSKQPGSIRWWNSRSVYSVLEHYKWKSIE